ncbi:MAG: hypothetical protein ACE5OO_06275, partial [Candidatus Bathyarchaeia archaeon]
MSEIVSTPFFVARRLGAAVKVVTKVGGDLPSDYMGQLRELGIGLRGQIVEGAKTTRFTLDYRGAERRLSGRQAVQGSAQE